MTVDLEDISYGANRLYQLLSVLTDNMVQMDYVRDGKRDESMDQAAALAWIARDLARQLDDGLNAASNLYVLRDDGDDHPSREAA